MTIVARSRPNSVLTQPCQLPASSLSSAICFSPAPPLSGDNANMAPRSRAKCALISDLLLSHGVGRMEFNHERDENARSQEGIEHPEKPTAALRSWPRGRAFGKSAESAEQLVPSGLIQRREADAPAFGADGRCDLPLLVPMRGADVATETGPVLGIRAVTSTVCVEHDYSITWSARPSTDCGIVSPRALAVLRLMTSSNFVGCSTGKSAGLAPFRILSTKTAARRHTAAMEAPKAINPPASANPLSKNIAGNRRALMSCTTR